MTRVLVAVGLVLAACGDAATTSTTTTNTHATSTSAAAPPAAAATTTSAPVTTLATSPAGPGRGGTVVIGLEGEIGTLNPYAASDTEHLVSIVGQLHLVGISDVDAELRRVPEVVEELPTVGNGGVVVGADGAMTVRYAIRDEAVWADGTPISGDDFALTLDMLAATPGARLPFGLVDVDVYREVVPGSAVAGPKSFEFALPEPTVLHEEMFSTILPAHDVAGTDLLADWNDRVWMEGGPFRLDTWVPGESLSFVRNDNYWKTDDNGVPLPYLDRVEVRLAPFGDDLLGPFLSREVDVIEPVPFAERVEALREREAEGVEVTVRTSQVWEHINFQFGENNPNTDSLNTHVEFRRAVAHAIDRQAIAELPFFVNRQALRSYLDLSGPGVGGDGWDRYPHDPERARELLAGLCEELGRDCVADPPRLVFATTSNTEIRPAVGEAVAAMLEDVGIEVELDFQDSAAFFGEVLDRGGWDVGMWAWVLLPGSPGLIAIHDVFDPDSPPPDGQNYYRWGTPPVPAADDPIFVQGPALLRDEHSARFAEIVDAMRTTADVDELRALAREAEEILAGQSVIIPLMARSSVLAVWADEVGGVEHNGSGAGFTWNAEEWYRVDR